MSEQPLPRSFPWSVPLAIAEIPPGGAHRELVAGAADLAALTAVAHVNAISNLTASFDVAPERSEQFRVRGVVRGVVSQTCVVSLDPIENRIEEDIDVLFAPEKEAEAAQARLAAADSDADVSEDPPEPILRGVIDLGNLAAEFFVLGIDPYPRRPDIQFEPIHTPPDPADHPFAALAALKGEPDEPGPGKAG